jgi:hypothetical protein
MMIKGKMSDQISLLIINLLIVACLGLVGFGFYRLYQSKPARRRQRGRGCGATPTTPTTPT